MSLLLEELIVSEEQNCAVGIGPIDYNFFFRVTVAFKRK